MHIHRSASSFATITIFFSLALFLLLASSGCTKEEQGPAGPQGPPGGPDDLTNPNILPTVIFTTPANASTGPFGLYNSADGFGRPHFILRFNKLMATFSVGERTVRCTGFDRPVVARLHEDYYGPIRFASGLSTDVFNNFLAFAVYDSVTGYGRMPYHVGRIVTVSIDTTIEDINGHHLAQPFTFSFLPEPYFRVLRLIPEDGTTDASQEGFLSAGFNSRVGSDILTSLHVIPQPNGRWTINEYDSLSVSFRSAQPFPFGSSYTFAVDNTARDKYGNQLRQSYGSAFAITQFRVRSTYPENGRTNVYPGTQISVYLTGLTDTSTMRQAFSIFPVVAGTLYPYGEGFSFYPTDGLMPGTLYTVTLSTALTALDGTRLPAPAIFSFTTAPFRVGSVYPEYGATNVWRAGTIYISCNTVVDTGSVRGAFTISPSSNMTFSLNPNSTAFSVSPTTPLAANRFYTVTISTALRSKSGANLQTPYTTVFTTGQ